LIEHEKKIRNEKETVSPATTDFTAIDTYSNLISRFVVNVESNVKIYASLYLADISQKYIATQMT